MVSARARAVFAVAVLAGLTVPAHAGAAVAPPPHAEAAGGDVVELTYPAIVRTHVKRAQRALARATEKFEDDRPEAAARPLKVVRRQMAAAWRGARYKIRTAPPPPADEDRVHPRARRSGDGPTGPTYASPADSAFKVLTLQHDVTSDVAQLLEDAADASLGDIGRTLDFALDRRDAALEDITSLAPPAPSDDEDDADDARASGDGPTVTTFETVMPNVLPQLDDELDTVAAMTSDSPDPTDAEGVDPDDAEPAELSAGARTLLDAAAAKIERTRSIVNRQWPPIPNED